MKNKYGKYIVRFLVQTGAAALLLLGAEILYGGMYLIGVPKAEETEKVTILYRDAADEEKEITDRKQIELAVKLTGFLRYSLLEEADGTEDPVITIVYHMKNGRTIAVSANRDTVWWKGKAHVIREQDMFINLAEGIFFSEDLEGK